MANVGWQLTPGQNPALHHLAYYPLAVLVKDAYLLEASRVRGCGLLTLDVTLAEAARAAGVSLIEVPR